MARSVRCGYGRLIADLSLLEGNRKWHDQPHLRSGPPLAWSAALGKTRAAFPSFKESRMQPRQLLRIDGELPSPSPRGQGFASVRRTARGLFSARRCSMSSWKPWSTVRGGPPRVRWLSRHSWQMHRSQRKVRIAFTSPSGHHNSVPVRPCRSWCGSMAATTKMAPAPTRTTPPTCWLRSVL